MTKKIDDTGEIEVYLWKLEIPQVRFLIAHPHLTLFERSSLLQVLGQLVDILDVTTGRPLNEFRRSRAYGPLRISRQT